ncbi:MAG: hypothetical protein ACK4HW_04205 [Roseinatronobacter sp.]
MQIYLKAAKATIPCLGGADNDTRLGGAGDDSLDGGSGHDHLASGQNNDWLDGGNGNDTLYGDNGDDTLGGGAGRDWLYGGAENDVFLWRSESELSTGSARDIIADFEMGDLIGLQVFGLTFIGIERFTATGVAELQFNPNNSQLQIDLDGNGTNNYQIMLLNVATFDGSALIL